mgnify:CR=1 FL=1
MLATYGNRSSQIVEIWLRARGSSQRYVKETGIANASYSTKREHPVTAQSIFEQFCSTFDAISDTYHHDHQHQFPHKFEPPPLEIRGVR